MANAKEKLLIKRYASRRLYNTETSDYVTLEDISGFIRDGRVGVWVERPENPKQLPTKRPKIKLQQSGYDCVNGFLFTAFR